MGDASQLEPIYSSLAEDPDLGDAIHAFVVGLAERIDGLQDAEAEGDAETVAAVARALGAESARLGYESMADSAARLVDACDATDRDSLHKAVVDVTEIAQRVRQGHRGAL